MTSLQNEDSEKEVEEVERPFKEEEWEDAEESEEQEEIVQEENEEDAEEEPAEEYQETPRRSKRQRKHPERYHDYVMLTYKDSVMGPDRSRRLETIKQEKQSLEENKTWDVVDAKQVKTIRFMENGYSR